MRYFRIAYKRGRQRFATVIAAENKLDAMQEFQHRALGVLIEIREVGKPLSVTLQEWVARYRSPIKNRRVAQEPYIAALRQLAVMLDAGMPVNHCLNEVIESTADEMIRAIFTSILMDVESGVSLSKAAEPYTLQLGNLSLSMIRLGEQTGALAESIGKLADILDRIEENRRQLIKATRYPLFTIFAMAIAFGVVITMVVPQFQEMFAQSGVELPFATRLLLWVEDALRRYALWIVVGGIGGAVAFSWFYGRYDKVRLATDKFLLKVYIVGKVTHYAMIGRFVYIFNVLMSAGIPITDALAAATGVVENSYMRRRLEIIRTSIEEGQSLASGFQESGMFLNMVNQMVKAGEQSGALGRMLDKITKFYQERYQYIVENVATMIEPILIAAIAGFVLLLALGIFLPMWSMAEAAGM